MSDDDALRAQAGDLGVAPGPLADRPDCAGSRSSSSTGRYRSAPISRSDAARIRERHTLDSLRAVPVVEGADEAADLGSGAGLPGVVVAIALPRVRMLLIERRPQRAAFLELAVEELGLSNAAVFAGRVEDVPATVDVALAQGVRPVRRGLGSGPRDPSTWRTARLLRGQPRRRPPRPRGIRDPERPAHARA